MTTGTTSDRHPRRDDIAAAVASWYREPAAELGYEATRRPYGSVLRQPASGHVAVTLETAPEDLPAHLDALEADLGRTALLRVEGEAVDAALRPSLEARGWTAGAAQLYLAWVGPPPARTAAPGLVLRDVPPSDLETWVRTKQQGFAGNDDDPDAAALAHEVAMRRAEAQGGTRFVLAWARGEPAGALAAYTGEDWLVFSLSTRVGHRNGGVARALLTSTVEDALDGGARSVMINCDPTDTPVQWYRRLGFRDAVYWCRTYTAT